MTEPDILPFSDELEVIRAGMARQHADARASLEPARPVALRIAASLIGTGQVLLLGDGSSHLCSRMVAPLYRKLGFAAHAQPLFEQLGAPQPLEGQTVLVSSRSGACPAVHRWIAETGGTADSFGLTLAPDSVLARSLPGLIGAGGGETGIGTARSMTVTLALHMAILSALGGDTAQAEGVLRAPPRPDVGPAIAALSGARSIVTLGPCQQALAEAVAIDLCKLLRKPCLALPCTQPSDGTEGMLATDTGLIGFRDRAALRSPAPPAATRRGGALVMFDASGAPPVDGAITVSLPPLDGMAAMLAILGAAQELVVGLATLVESAGGIRH